MINLTPIILCGGFGTRLWPLSRRDMPKQFASIIDGGSLMEQTLRRLQALEHNRPICVANEAHRFLVSSALDAVGMDAEVLLEPFARNTAPALTAVAALLLERDPDAILLSLPADHYIPDTAAFASTVTRGMGAAAAGWIVTFGITPDSPSSEYGYIEPGAELRDGVPGRRVDRFLEKPDAIRAAELIASGCAWNAGIFLVRADVLLEAMGRHASDVLDSAKSAVAARRRDGPFTRLDPATYSACRLISIDHAVLEKHDRVAVIEFPHFWSDLGSWDSVAAHSRGTSEVNCSTGDVRFEDCQNVFVHGGDRLTVAIGLENLLVVDTPDALLISSLGASEGLKDAVAKLEAEKRPEVLRYPKVHRPWGSYERVCAGENFEVRRLVVNPGARISKHYHLHRTEHWVVVSGTGRVTCGDREFLLRENESGLIPAGTLHSLENPGRLPLEIIETLSGSYFGEDDVIRPIDAQIQADMEELG